MSLPPVESARPDEIEPALRLLLRRFDREAGEDRVRRALDLIAAGELPADGILVARDAGRLVGAILCTPLPGRGGLVWAPATTTTAGKVVEDYLVRAALVWLRDRGARLAQAFLYPEEEELGSPLLRNGFALVTRLLYLRHNLVPGAWDDTPEQACPGLSLLPYPQAGPERFHPTLLSTYERTLDCPELNGVRTIEEIIEGHKAQGAYDPERWWLALLNGRPAGVLLVNEVPELACWDLAYVGVVPEARGRGVGRALTILALERARQAGARELTLAVDQRNTPARHLYGRLSFELFDQRDVYLAFYRDGA
ncbi:MAG: GNAT family N-acetyltransferase [Gemmataceae bacterium]|nr:GNAT family N-acetyltransferase [Gemmataceae bacterium]